MVNPFYHYKETFGLYGTQVTFQFNSGADKWIKRLERLEYNSKNLRKPLEQWYEYMLGSFERSFKAEGRPRWARLSEYTIQDRINRGFGSAPILDRTGAYRDMKSHLTTNVSDNSIEVESSLKTRSGYNLLSLHQNGWQHQSGKRVSARPLTVQDRDKAELTRYINDYLIGD